MIARPASLRVGALAWFLLVATSFGLLGQAGDSAALDPEAEADYLEAVQLLYSKSESDQSGGTKILKRLAVGGHARSQYLLGRVYQQGFGAQASERQAMRWFERSADSGYPMAMLALAELILGGEDDEEKDYLKAKSLLDQVLDPATSLQVSPEEFGMFRSTKSRANYLLGMMYLNAWGIEEDTARAMEMLIAASRTGDKDASMYLAIAYAKGEEIEKDIDKAKEYFELLDLQSADEYNKSMESIYGNSGDASDVQNMLEASQMVGQLVSQMVYALQTDFAREVLVSKGEDFDAEFAADLLKMAAEGDYVEAKLWLGLLYYRGLGVEQDYTKAGDLLAKAVVDFWVLAQYNLGILIRLGYYQETDELKERELLRLAAEQGLYAAQAALDGDEGLDLMSPEEARDLCLAKAEEGDPRALYSLAVRKTNGWLVDVESDLSRIAELYRTAAREGSARAQYVLGMMLMTGQGMQPDFQLGLTWLRSASFRELPEALYFMGDCYANGLGVQPNLAEAFRYYSKAADMGYDNAKNRLAAFYYHGVYVPKNQYKAAQLYLEAAGEGDAEAAYNLAECYLVGTGVRMNVKESLRWYARSADQGNLLACYRLAGIYEEGLVVDRDEVEIAFWQERAAEMGDKQAMKQTAFNYFKGRGSPRNRGKAANWLAAYQSHPKPTELGDLYFMNEYEEHSVVKSLLPEDFSALIMSADLMAEEGWSGSNLEEARAIYERLSAKGSMGAKLRLAHLHLSEGSKSRNAKRGLQILKSLYAKNKSESYPGKLRYAKESAYLISQCYADGLGVKASVSKQLNWLESSAKLGHLKAQYELGVMLANGDKVTRDRNRGAQWLLSSARAGNAESQLHLARMHLESPVSSLENDAVINWLKALVDSGSGEARLLLRKYGVKYKETEPERGGPKPGEEEEINPWAPVKAA